jgi:hypothetical protein
VYFSQVTCIFSVVANSGLLIIGAVGHLKPEMTLQFDSLTLFPLVFNTHHLPNMHHLKVVVVFIDYGLGGILILTAWGCLRLEVTSPVDRATTIFFIHVA